MQKQTVLKIRGLTKHFGRITAVNQLNLEIEAGQVFGILGPNGSGKTTTLGMILDVIAPSAGEYEWFGGDKPTVARKKIGSILETPCFYPYMTAVQNLKVAAHIKGVDASRIEQVLRQVNLHARKDDPFKGFSLGMKQRLSIAAALLADPPVLILDEPTNGLDPEGIAEVRNLIKEISQAGKTIILASHLLDEVQKVCTDFCVLKNGDKLHQGSIYDILGETNRAIVSSADNARLKTILPSYDQVTHVEDHPDGLLVEMQEGSKSGDLNTIAFENNIILHTLLTEKNSLEQEFLKILN